MDLLLDRLNAEQRQAVTSTEGFIAVVAGAGSGKTRALSHRFAYLVNEIGIYPGNILCVTFTNKAASEMRQRIRALTGDGDTGYVNTFHGFCVSVLQEDSHAIGYPKSFMVLDNNDIDDMLNIIYEERGLTLKDMTYAKARDMFEMRKCLENPMYYLDMINLSQDALYEKYQECTEVRDILFYGYLYMQRKCYGLDYNDLIILTLSIFRENEEIRTKWQKRLQYIMVDEFQDIDPLQYELMEVLCAYHKNLFVVGDPDQTIYSWRGARIGYILDFANTHPGTKIIMMMQNYRSSSAVIQCANSLIEKNKNRIEKNLIPVWEETGSVRYHHSRTQEEEAKAICAEIRRLHAEGVPYKDMTVLYRAHFVSRAVEQQLIKDQVPYRIYSGAPFYARTEVKDALAYLRMLVTKDDLSFRRTVNKPKRNIGSRRMGFLESFVETYGRRSLLEALEENVDDPLFKNTKAKQYLSLIQHFTEEYEGKPISKLLTEILEESGYETMLRTEGAQDRLDNLSELKQSVLNYEMSCGEETDLLTYLDHVALFTNQDTVEDKDEVRMMTVHAAKGLEFEHVFLCGMNEGIFPSRKTASQSAMEEERRLAFVAFTRAKKSLFITDAEGKNMYFSYGYPSRFILDIDRSYIQYDSELPESLIENALVYYRSIDEKFELQENMPFAVGDRVTHPIFKEGTITAIDIQEGKIEILFEQFLTTRVLSLQAVKKLKKL